VNVKLIKAEDNKGHFCFLSNLREYLNYYGYPCTESWLGGMIGFMGFYYSTKALPSKEVIHGRNGTFHELFYCLQERLDMQLTGKEFFSDEECLNQVEEILNTKHPVLVWVDQYYLDYSSYYHMAHYWSLVHVTGISEDGVKLYDHEIRHVSIKDFKKSIISSEKARIYYKKNQLIGYRYSEAEVVSAGFQRVIELMQKGSEGEEHYGIRGMECFMEELKLSSDQEKLYNICYQLNRASGAAATRRSMCTYLSELKSKWELPRS